MSDTNPITPDSENEPGLRDTPETRVMARLVLARLELAMECFGLKDSDFRTADDHITITGIEERSLRYGGYEGEEKSYNLPLSILLDGGASIWDWKGELDRIERERQEREKREREEAEAKRRAEAQEARDRAEYARLHARFGGQS